MCQNLVPFHGLNIIQLCEEITFQHLFLRCASVGASKLSAQKVPINIFE